MRAPTSMKPYTRRALSLLAGLSTASLLLPMPGLAQATKIDPLEDLRTTDGSSDPFSGSSNASSVYDMIHRARLNNGMNMNQFRTQLNQQINDAAAGFRRQQLQRMQTPAQAAHGG
ncbi:MAG: hypothetical protein GDA48_23800 [Hormoscilla sp. GM102CHS1]|nr:hypothetical protein [Hormoscilla sp. GM102CHS1]